MTTPPEKIVYTAVATSRDGGREGRSTTSSGTLDLTLTPPPETGGSGAGTNPEELFAAGYSACFNSSLGAGAKKHAVSVSGSRVRAHVGMGPEGESFALSVHLEVFVPDLDTATTQRVADTAHEMCPYSKAIRGNVPVTVTAVTEMD